MLVSDLLAVNSRHIVQPGAYLGVGGAFGHGPPPLGHQDNIISTDGQVNAKR